MREVKFRGQVRRLGEKVNLKGEPIPSKWVYGGIFQGVERSVIYDGETYEKHTVYNETVGQYTGLKDKNGREVYEGDLYQYTSTSEIGIGGKIIKTSEITRIKPIVFEEGAFYHGHDLLADVIEYDDTLTYVGNIYDNPELLGDSK